MNQTESDRSRRELLTEKLLDSYFQFRSPLPRDGSIEEHKTTLQIQDELEPMMHVDRLDIVEYMDSHDYGFITEQDGTVSWAVWRQACPYNDNTFFTFYQFREAVRRDDALPSFVT